MKDLSLWSFTETVEEVLRLEVARNLADVVAWGVMPGVAGVASPATSSIAAATNTGARPKQQQQPHIKFQRQGQMKDAPDSRKCGHRLQYRCRQSFDEFIYNEDHKHHSPHRVQGVLLSWQ